MKKRIGKRERARNKNNQALDKAIEAGATERRIGKLLHLTGRTLVPSEKKILSQAREKIKYQQPTRIKKADKPFTPEIKLIMMVYHAFMNRSKLRRSLT